MARNRRNNRNGPQEEEDRTDPIEQSYVQGARVMQYAPQEGGTWYLQGSDNPGMQLVSVKLEEIELHLLNLKIMMNGRKLIVWFGECNGPMIYELKRQIANYTQGNQGVMVYYNNLNKMWDELACLLPTATCTCVDGAKS